jgi:formate hydrogenlyase subunit 6/NADH:ubiquinone oxidoreductase subunit I
LLKSKEVEEFRYDRTVYTAAVGKCGTCYYCVNVCPENAIKEWNPPHHQPLFVYTMYKMCGSLPTRRTEYNTLEIKWTEAD